MRRRATIAAIVFVGLFTSNAHPRLQQTEPSHISPNRQRQPHTGFFFAFFPFVAFFVPARFAVPDATVYILALLQNTRPVSEKIASQLLRQ